MAEHRTLIVGDVASASDVTVNRKGGSFTATLKKPLRERVEVAGNRMYGAALEFGGGQSVLLLRGEDEEREAPQMRVTQLGRNRYEIELADEGENAPVDDLTAAFLMAKRELFKRGELNLLEPVSADEFEAEMRAKFETADRAVPDRHRSD